MRAFTTTLALTFTLCATAASAQVGAPRFDFSAGASGQVTSTEFTQRLSFPLYEETAEITGPVDPGKGVRIEIAGGVRIWRGLSAGVQVSRGSSSGRMEATYSLPNPFLFSSPRTATIETDTTQSTLDVHLQVRLALLRQGRWTATVFGGPSFTWLDQALAPDRITYTYTYPFEEILLQESGSGETSGQATGGHAGFTIAREMTPRVNLQGLVRWNRTNVDLETDLGTTRVPTGGVQVGGGVQFRF